MKRHGGNFGLIHYNFPTLQYVGDSTYSTSAIRLPLGVENSTPNSSTGRELDPISKICPINAMTGTGEQRQHNSKSFCAGLTVVRELRLQKLCSRVAVGLGDKLLVSAAIAVALLPAMKHSQFLSRPLTLSLTLLCYNLMPTFEREEAPMTSRGSRNLGQPLHNHTTPLDELLRR